MANESNPFGRLSKMMSSKAINNQPYFGIAEVIDGSSKETIKVKFSEIEIRPEQIWTNDDLFKNQSLQPDDKAFIIPIESEQKYVILCKVVNKDDDGE